MCTQIFHGIGIISQSAALKSVWPLNGKQVAYIKVSRYIFSIDHKITKNDDPVSFKKSNYF